MKKKKCKIICLGIALFLVGVLGVSFANHKLRQIQEEKELMKNEVGEQVEVDGKNVNTLTIGNENADDILVFMQGLGMGDTIVSTRPMFEPLEEKYKICLINRYGNGMSDDTNKRQTVSEIVELYRNVLAKSKEKGPYTLVAHSISGIYATYWAQKYPEEIKSIIYLDADPVECYVTEGKAEFGELAFVYAEYIASELGFQRFFVSDDTLLGETENQVYTKQQNIIRKYLIYRHSMSKATCSEFKLYYQNAQTVLSGNMNIEIPQLYIAANRVEGDYFDNIYSKTLQEQFGEDEEKIQSKIDKCQEIIYEKMNIMKNREYVTTVELSGPHCIYEYTPDKVADAMMTFLDK